MHPNKGWRSIGILLLLPSCIGTVTYVESHPDMYPLERNNSLEITAFLDEFSHDNGWETGAQDIHINWETVDERNQRYRPTHGSRAKNDPAIDSAFGIAHRTGKLYITMDGVFSDFYMRDLKYPVQWLVSLYGGRNLYSYCSLETIQTGFGCDMEGYFRGKHYLKKIFGFTSTSDLKYGIPSYKEYELDIHGRHILILYKVLAMNAVCDQAFYMASDGGGGFRFPRDFFDYYKDTVRHEESN